MRVLIFGATGMIGQAVVKEAIAAQHIDAVRLVSRTSAHISHPKIKETIARDFFDLSVIEDDLRGYDACIFCVGVSAAFMDEKTYTNLTYDLTLCVAATLLRLNPHLVFVYVTGQGADSSEVGSIMWARVKGKTENALLRTPFKAAYMFRPGAILPLDGIRSKTRLYDFLYLVFSPLIGIARWINPAWIPTTRDIGRAMLAVCDGQVPKRILENADIVELAASFNRQDP